MRGRKNKGFTLVELIVVIVILAILIGVTIGGIYQYVTKAQKNTFISNCDTFVKQLELACNNDEELKALLGEAASNTDDGLFYIDLRLGSEGMHEVMPSWFWNCSDNFDTLVAEEYHKYGSWTDTQNKKLVNILNRLFPDGFSINYGHSYLELAIVNYDNSGYVAGKGYPTYDYYKVDVVHQYFN